MTAPQPNQPESNPAKGASDAAVASPPPAAHTGDAPGGTPAIAAPPSATQPAKLPWAAGNGPVILFVVLFIPALIGLSVLLAKGIQHARRTFAELSSQVSNRRPGSDFVSPAQREAEAALAAAATGDAAAISKVLAESPRWTGGTRRTPQTDRSISICLNSADLRERAAALSALLSLDGITADQAGLGEVRRALNDPSQRDWALWMLGALGNRGVDPPRTVKIAQSFLQDPDARVRGAAVISLSIIATDETIPMLLDRFRNDSSPAVQEDAARSLGSTGMYTRAQRLTAGASLIRWLDDPSLAPQQRAWALHVLTDVSRKNFGANSSAWRAWYRSQSTAR